MTPIISIIIPTFNSDLTVVASLKSVITQTFKDYEVLLMDGGSTDKTLELVKSFDKKITVASSPDNGVYDAMNKGISKAQGEWLFFLGSDDFFFDDKVLADVSLQLDATRSLFYYGDVLRITSAKIHAGEFDMNRLARINISHQAIFYHKSLFDRLGEYNLRFPVLADYEFNLRCFGFQETKPSYLNRTICKVTDSHGLSSEVIDTSFLLAKKSLIKKHFGLSISTIEIENHLAEIGYQLINKKKYSLGLRILLQIWQGRPLYYLKNMLYWVKESFRSKVDL